VPKSQGSIATTISDRAPTPLLHED
jgi:hypothetical protein